LIKAGTGTLTLSGANTYTGNTTVQEGALVTGAISGPGTTEVYAGAQLSATSIVQNTLIIGAGGSVTIRETAGAASSASAVPEPATWVLIGTALLGLLAFRRRR
jgi:autotransporter-associated beta strand protein